MCAQSPYPFTAYCTVPIKPNISEFRPLCSGVDIGAEEVLTQDREDAALGLLTLSGADGDEVVDGGRSSGSYCDVSSRFRIGDWVESSKDERTISAIQVSEVQNISRAALGRLGS